MIGSFAAHIRALGIRRHTMSSSKQPNPHWNRSTFLGPFIAVRLTRGTAIQVVVHRSSVRQPQSRLRITRVKHFDARVISLGTNGVFKHFAFDCLCFEVINRVTAFQSRLSLYANCRNASYQGYFKTNSAYTLLILLESRTYPACAQGRPREPCSRLYCPGDVNTYVGVRPVAVAKQVHK